MKHSRWLTSSCGIRYPQHRPQAFSTFILMALLEKAVETKLLVSENYLAADDNLVLREDERLWERGSVSDTC